MNLFSTPVAVALSFLVLLAIGAILIRLLPKKRQSQAVPGAYEALTALLTPAERSFFGVLQQATEAEYQIFAKVRLADIVKPVRNPSRSAWQSAFNRIAGKHVDFVLCNLSNMAIVAVIELDDRTHERLERSTRDGLVDSALANAHIPFLRILARQSYSPSQVREQITEALTRRTANA
jgi:hypothetical protein